MAENQNTKSDFNGKTGQKTEIEYNLRCSVLSYLTEFRTICNIQGVPNTGPKTHVPSLVSR